MNYNSNNNNIYNNFNQNQLMNNYNQNFMNNSMYIPCYNNPLNISPPAPIKKIEKSFNDIKFNNDSNHNI